VNLAASPRDAWPRYDHCVARRTTRRLMRMIAATDASFERAEHQGELVWVGKCIHCNAALVVRLDGTPVGNATVEHIVPQSRGGTDEPANLALACARCNYQKGRRHDRHRRPSERAKQVEAALLERRRRRLRDADE
jgi:5-methylcytosine-specific restriction endonuclease McrA